MKTLDEVIKALDMCQRSACEQCPYYDPNVDICDDVAQADVLHYLKAFRDAKDALEAEKDRYAEAVKNCEQAEAKYTKAVLDMNRNDPLDWEQLKQMEGRPVWIETDENLKFWTIVDNFRTICNQECLCCAKGYMCRSTHARGDWQAYRKERS